MITTLMLYSLLLGALVALGALALDWAARRALLPRRWGWVGALALLLGLTISAPWRVQPSAATGFVDSVSVRDATGVVGESLAPSWYDAVRAVITAPARTVLTSVSARVPARTDRMVGILWAISSLLAVSFTVTALRRLDRQRRRWPHATVQGHPVRMASHDGPAVYGVLHPEIVLPSGLLMRSATEQQLVLVHEDEHRQARDPLVLAVSAFAVALIPWHPVAWWCASRLRLAVELDCDARVLHRGAKPRHYGEMLVSLAASMSSRRGLLPALALLDSRGHLERRLLAMTSRPSRRTPLHLVLFVVFGTTATAVACSTDVPTAAQIRDADVASVTQSLGVPASSELTEYIVDERPVTAAEARAIRADQIASIDVRGTSDPKVTEVRIVTGKPLLKTKGTLKPMPAAEQGNVILRGSATTDGAQPLFVIDGVIQAPGTNAIREMKLNPDQIESIEVFKGAAGEGMYGARGVNGVIVVKTKQP